MKNQQKPIKTYKQTKLLFLGRVVVFHWWQEIVSVGSLLWLPGCISVDQAIEVLEGFANSRSILRQPITTTGDGGVITSAAVVLVVLLTVVCDPI